MFRYSEAQLADIANWRLQGVPWADLTKKFNSKYKIEQSQFSLQKAQERYKDIFEIGDKLAQVKTLQSVARSKATASVHAKENRNILSYLNAREDFMEEMRGVVKSLNKKFPKVAMPRGRKPSGIGMTKELCIADPQIGLLTEETNLDVFKERFKKVATQTIDNLEASLDYYKVEKLIVAFLGDLIQNSYMHGLESKRCTQFGNAKQTVECIKLFFFSLIVPLNLYCQSEGIEMEVPCITGNHDRMEKGRIYVNPGEENFTFIIYTMLEMLSEQSGLKRISFQIPKGIGCQIEVYGKTVHYEHYDHAKAHTEAALQNLLRDRQDQLKKIIHYMRGGHYHSGRIMQSGKIMICPGLCGQEHYAEAKGYASSPQAFLNSYVDDDRLPDPYISTTVLQA